MRRLHLLWVVLALGLVAPRAQATDLAVSKVVVPGPVIYGQTVSYTITVDNTSAFGGGPLAASVTLTDTYPFGFEWLSITGDISSGQCSSTPETYRLTCVFPMAAGQVKVAVVTFRVNRTGSATNTVSVMPDIGDPFLSNNQAESTVSISLPPPADLAVTKRVERLGQPITTVNSGQRFTYRITVTNIGGRTSASATLRDLLPPQVTYELHLLSVLQICTVGPGNASVECATGPIEPGATVELIIDVTANGAGQVANTAELPGFIDANIENNGSTVVTTMFGLADLSVQKTGPSEVEIGQGYQYSIVVRNAGPETAAVTMTDMGSLPFAMRSATTTAGACALTNEFRVDCTHPGLPAGGEFTVTIATDAVQIAPAATNSVEVSGSVPDPNSENNRSSVSTQILARQTDIEVVKSSDRSRIGVGDPVTFTIVVTNTSSYPAEGVRMTDILASAFDFVSATATAGTCANAGRNVVCQLGTLAGGASATVTLVARGAAIGQATNTASVTTTTPETSDGNNQSGVSIEVYAVGLTFGFASVTDQTCVNGVLDLGVRTTDGNRVTIRVSVTNSHPEYAESVTLHFKEFHSGKYLGDGSGVLAGTVPPSQTVVFEYTWNTTGWAWNDDETAFTDPRRIHVEVYRAGGLAGSIDRDVFVDPKPIILVHGLWSNAAAWAPFPGFAESLHPGYAGRVIPVAGMDTGLFPLDALLEPTATHQMFTRTTIGQNAASLDAYVDAVRKATGACHVDIVAHSMGGLISRHWIHHTMPQAEDDGERMLRHLVQLGTPNEGSPCADDIMAMYPSLVAGAPTTFTATQPPNNVIELTTSQAIHGFSPQVNNTKGVPIFLAYSDILPFTCRLLESGDGVVAVSSALARVTSNPTFAGTSLVSMIHTAMTGDKGLFDGFIGGILAEPPGGGAPGYRVAEPQKQAQEAGTSAGAAGEQYFITARHDVMRDLPLVVDLPVPGGTAFGISYLAPAVASSRLTDPTGAEVAYVAAGTEAATLGLRAHTVANPVPGTWRLTMQQSSVDRASILLAAWIAGSDLTVEGSAAAAAEANHALVVAQLVRGVQPVTGATVWAVAIAEGGISRFPLRDDGAAGDETSGDGRYSALFRPEASGRHLVAIDATAGSDTRVTTFVYEATGISGVATDPDDGAIPKSTSAGAVFPNPASSHAALPFELDRESEVDIRLYDLLGRQVLAVRSGRLSAGTHEAGFDAGSIPAGRYFVHARLGDRVHTRVLMVAR